MTLFDRPHRVCICLSPEVESPPLLPCSCLTLRQVQKGELISPARTQRTPLFCDRARFFFGWSNATQRNASQPSASMATRQEIDLNAVCKHPRFSIVAARAMSFLGSSKPAYDLPTAAYMTVVLKKPPLVFSMTCWYTDCGGWFITTVPCW